MTDRRDEGSVDRADDRLAAAEDRAVAAEHRADIAERRHDDDDADRGRVVRTKPTYGLGSLLALLSALAIAVSTFLVWGKEGLFADGETRGSNTSLQFLWDISPADEQPALFFALIPAALLVLIGAFIPRLRVLGIIGGAVALAVAVLFVISVGRATSDDELTISEGTFELLGLGWWFAGIGGIVAIVGSLLIPRRDVVR